MTPIERAKWLHALPLDRIASSRLPRRPLRLWLAFKVWGLSNWLHGFGYTVSGGPRPLRYGEEERRIE